MFKNSKPIHIITTFIMRLTAPCNSRVGENCVHNEIEILDLNTHKNSLFPFNRNVLERNWENNSNSYKDVHDGKPIRIWIVIRTKMYMTKTHTRIMWLVIRTKMCMPKTHQNMDSHSYKDVHDKNS